MSRAAMEWATRDLPAINKLPRAEMTLLAALARRHKASRRDPFWTAPVVVSYAALAEETGYSVRTLKSVAASLQRLGLIAIQPTRGRQGRQGANGFVLLGGCANGRRGKDGRMEPVILPRDPRRQAREAGIPMLPKAPKTRVQPHTKNQGVRSRPECNEMGLQSATVAPPTRARARATLGTVALVPDVGSHEPWEGEPAGPEWLDTIPPREAPRREARALRVAS